MPLFLLDPLPFDLELEELDEDDEPLEYELAEPEPLLALRSVVAPDEPEPFTFGFFSVGAGGTTAATSATAGSGAPEA